MDGWLWMLITILLVCGCAAIDLYIDHRRLSGMSEDERTIFLERHDKSVRGGFIGQWYSPEWMSLIIAGIIAVSILVYAVIQ